MGALLLHPTPTGGWIVKCKTCRLKSRVASKREALQLWRRHRATVEHQINAGMKLAEDVAKDRSRNAQEGHEFREGHWFCTDECENVKARRAKKREGGADAPEA